MTHSYNVSGMTCDACVASVKSKLLMNAEITGVEISREGNARITMQKHMSLKSLQETIGRDSKYRISEEGTSHHHRMVAEAAGSWFKTYRPLLLIAAYITGLATLLADGNLHLGMNYFMAGFFLVFSFFKFLDLKGFADSYARYDLLAMKLPVYGFIYPFIELFLGLAYATGFRHLYTLWATLIVMGFSVIGVLRSVLNKQKIQCACLGVVFNLPMSTVTIIEDLLMVAMAIYMLI